MLCHISMTPWAHTVTFYRFHWAQSTFVMRLTRRSLVSVCNEVRFDSMLWTWAMTSVETLTLCAPCVFVAAVVVDEFFLLFAYVWTYSLLCSCIPTEWLGFGVVCYFCESKSTKKTLETNRGDPLFDSKGFQTNHRWNRSIPLRFSHSSPRAVRRISSAQKIFSHQRSCFCLRSWFCNWNGAQVIQIMPRRNSIMEKCWASVNTEKVPLETQKENANRCDAPVIVRLQNILRVKMRMYVLSWLEHCLGPLQTIWIGEKFCRRPMVPSNGDVRARASLSQQKRIRDESSMGKSVPRGSGYSITARRTRHTAPSVGGRTFTAAARELSRKRSTDWVSPNRSDEVNSFSGERSSAWPSVAVWRANYHVITQMQIRLR